VSEAACSEEARRTCDAPRAAACRDKALGLWSASHAPRSLGRVFALFDRACGFGDLESCRYEGRLLLDGRGVARDAKRGVELLELSCDGGQEESCATLASRSRGSGTYASRYALELSCVRGDGEMCRGLAGYFWSGSDGYPVDKRRSLLFFTKGCDFGSAASCTAIGYGLYLGDGIEEDKTRAAPLFERGCSGGDPIGCAGLGLLAEYGEGGVAADLHRARELYDSSCGHGGGPYPCLHREMIDAYARGVPHDPAQAKAHWERECGAQNGSACAYLAILEEDGKAGTRDEDTEAALMRRACGSQRTLACDWLTDHGH
jgi:TPR repeat protein